MFLAIDIGNTKIKSALFENEELKNFYEIDNIDEFINSLKNKKIDKASISSVVPKATVQIEKYLNENLNIPVFIINAYSEFNLELNYDSIDTLGIDRLCSLEGALYLYKKSERVAQLDSGVFLVTVDCGTATTINIVKSPNIFIGGMIAPGFDTMINSLNINTAQLPVIDKSELTWDIGNDTNTSLASGIMNSVVGLIERALKILKEDYGATKISIYLTGGNANIISDFLSAEHQVEKSLVLIGIKEIYKLNKV